MLPFVATVLYDEKTNKYYLKHDFPERFQFHLAKHKDKRVTDNVKRFHKNNTLKQKAYLHSVVIPLTTALMDYPRHERDHVYNHLKLMYLKDTDENGNEYIREFREDSEDPGDTRLMSWFIDQIRQMVSIRYGVETPDAKKDYDKGFIEEWVTEIENG